MLTIRKELFMADKEQKVQEKEKELVLQLDDGKELNLKDLISRATLDGMKDAGFPLDENGKFSAKSLPLEIRDEATKKAEGYDRAANFIKSLTLPVRLHKEYGVKAIDTSAGSFGNVVPAELYEEILEQSKRWTIIRKYAFIFQMTGKIDVPTEGTGVTGYWVSENTTVTESNPTLGKVSLNDNSVAALIKVSWQLLRTSPQNITKFVAFLAAKAITDKEEAAFVGGDGSGKPKGIRTETLTSVAQAGASYTYDDLMALYYALPVAYRRNAQFLTSGKGARLNHALKDSQNRPLFAPGQPLDNLLGKPLLESEDIPANLGAGTNETEVIFGDFSNYWIKDGSNIEMATQDQIENLQTKIVVYKYVDGKCVNTNAFRKLTGVK